MPVRAQSSTEYAILISAVMLAVIIPVLLIRQGLRLMRKMGPSPATV